MTTHKEALTKARDALKELVEKFDSEQFTSICELDPAKDAIAAAEEALAQPEQKYTTTRNAWTGKATHKCNICGRDDFRSEHAAAFHECGEKAQPEQEPVIDKSAAVRIATALGWTPQRKPLTDEQIWQLVNDCVLGGDLHPDKFARAIEAAHSIKGDA